MAGSRTSTRGREARGLRPNKRGTHRGNPPGSYNSIRKENEETKGETKWKHEKWKKGNVILIISISLNYFKIMFLYINWAKTRKSHIFCLKKCCIFHSVLNTKVYQNALKHVFSINRKERNTKKQSKICDFHFLYIHYFETSKEI